MVIYVKVTYDSYWLLELLPPWCKNCIKLIWISILHHLHLSQYKPVKSKIAYIYQQTSIYIFGWDSVCKMSVSTRFMRNYSEIRVGNFWYHSLGQRPCLYTRTKSVARQSQIYNGRYTNIYFPIYRIYPNSSLSTNY